MNVFVLSTGRCGSMTVARAFAHAANYTAAHESRASLIEARLRYPDNHIESDNRLSWFLGSLQKEYGDDAHWVHLTRRPDEVVESYLRRWNGVISGRRSIKHMVRHPRSSVLRFREWRTDPTARLRGSIPVAFGYHIVGSQAPLTEEQRRAACALYVQTVNDNIDQFLSDKSKVSRLALEDLDGGFVRVWNAIGAQGSLPDARSELRLHHNDHRGGVPTPPV